MGQREVRTVRAFSVLSCVNLFHYGENLNLRDWLHAPTLYQVEARVSVHVRGLILSVLQNRGELFFQHTNESPFKKPLKQQRCPPYFIVMVCYSDVLTYGKISFMRSRTPG